MLTAILRYWTLCVGLGIILGMAASARPVPFKAPNATLRSGVQRPDPQIENADGGRLALSSLKGRVTVLVLAGKGTIDAGNLLLQEVKLATASEKEVVYVVCADIRGVPGFLRGQARGRVKGGLKQKCEETIEAFRKAQIAYEPRHASIVLLDWESQLSKELGIKENPDSSYQVLVLDKKGVVQLQRSQPRSKKPEESPLTAVVKATQAAALQKE